MYGQRLFHFFNDAVSADRYAVFRFRHAFANPVKYFVVTNRKNHIPISYFTETLPLGAGSPIADCDNIPLKSYLRT